MRSLRLARRATAIVAFLLAATLLWLVGWIALLATLQRRERRREWFGTCLLGLFKRLGATFIKVGQIMSTRPDLFPPHVIRALEKLQDDVGAFAFRHVERTIRDDFGKRPDDLFATFDVLPIASASVAQVHKATLPDGREVAVKVRRPRVEQIVAFDLTVMRWIAHVVALV